MEPRLALCSAARRTKTFACRVRDGGRTSRIEDRARAGEATADPQDIPRGWIQYAYRGYLLLQRADRALLEPRLPPRIFYNLMLAARKPG